MVLATFERGITSYMLGPGLPLPKNDAARRFVPFGHCPGSGSKEDACSGVCSHEATGMLWADGWGDEAG